MSSNFFNNWSLVKYLHSYLIFLIFLSLIFPASSIRVDSLCNRFRRVQFGSYIESLLDRGFNVEERLSLEGEIVRYSSVSLSLTLSRNDKVEQHIKKKTHKLNVLRFWVEGGIIILLYPSMSLSLTFLFDLFDISFLNFSSKWY